MPVRKKSTPTSPTPPVEATVIDATVSTVEDAEVTEKRTRTADPLLAAKRRLEVARKKHARITAKKEKIEDVISEWEASVAELEAAKDEFAAIVSDTLA